MCGNHGHATGTGGGTAVPEERQYPEGTILLDRSISLLIKNHASSNI